MAGNYPLLDRRNFFRLAGAAGIGAIADYLSCFAYAEEVPDFFAYAEEVPDFKCIFHVNVFGKRWIQDNPKEAAKLAEPIGKRLVFPDGKELAEFLTLDFDPKNLVKFDIYKGMNTKPVASNVREDNYQKVVLPRDTGSIKYSFRVTSPQHDGKIFEQDFLFMGNNELLNFALTRPEVSETERLTPVDNYDGLYPRAFQLTFDKGGVEYFVYGLESLAGKGIEPKDFAEYFQNRGKFKDFSDFRIYQEKNLKPSLEVSPEAEAK